MKTPLFFNGPATSNVSNTGNRYAALAGNGTTVTSLAAGSSPANVAGRSPIAGKLRNLAVRFPTALTQGSYEIILMKGATIAAMVETALKVTVTPSQPAPQNLVTQIDVAVGDYLAWIIKPSGTPTGQGNSIQIASVFDATTPGESLIWGFMNSGSTFGGLGIGSLNITAEERSVVVFPTAGTVSDLTIVCGAPGSGNSRTYTLRKGTAYGALSATAAAVTISDSATTGTDTDAVSFATGDLAVIGYTTGGSPGGSGALITAKWVPTTAGEALAFGTAAPSLSNTAARYLPFSGMTGGAESGETNVGNVAPGPMTVKRVQAALFTAPGGSASRTATLRRNAGATSLTTTVTGTATGNSAATDVSVALGDRLNFETVPAGTPAGTAAMAIGAVVTIDAAIDDPAFFPTDFDGRVHEGIRNLISRVTVGGVYSGLPTDIEVSIWDAPVGGSIVADWASADVQSGGVYSHTFLGLAVGGGYYQRVRDNGGTATLSSAEQKVGAVAPFAGQSQPQRLFEQDTSAGSPITLPADLNVSIMQTSAIGNVAASTITVTKLVNGMTGLARITGSGALAIARQWHEDVGPEVPLMLVACAYQGTAIEWWNSDRKGDFPANTDPTSLWGTSPTTGLAWHMAAANDYRASAVVWYQGTADVNASGSYAAALDTLKAKFESLYNGGTAVPLMLHPPHPRSDDGGNTFALRQVQFAKASSGGTWRVGGWALDHQLESDGNPHQANGTTGNARLGRRLGRALAKWLHDSALDIEGPRPVAVAFTNGTRNQIDIRFDRDISLADGTAYSGSPINLIAMFNTSVDSGATFTGLAAPDHSAQIISARIVRLTKTTGSWPSGTTRIDWLRGTPFASDAGSPDFVGTEANMETNFLSKVITDTTSFDGGRGMPAAPIMGTGFAVAEAGAGTVFGPFTLTVEDANGATASLPPFTITVTG